MPWSPCLHSSLGVAWFALPSPCPAWTYAAVCWLLPRQHSLGASSCSVDARCTHQEDMRPEARGVLSIVELGASAGLSHSGRVP